MLTAIDPDAPGYPAEAYGASHAQAEVWRKATAETLRQRRTGPWGAMLVMIFISGLLLSYPFIVSLFADARTPDSDWAYTDTGIHDLQDQHGLSGQGVRVCIVDTGIEITHPDFAHVQLIGYKDFIAGEDGVVQDRGHDRHGTMMAGILVAEGQFTGAAPGVGLIVAAALDHEGTTRSESIVAEAITWCWTEMGADIISLSLGGDPDPENPLGSETADAVESALEGGVFVVAAAGNSGGAGTRVTDVSVPANVEGVIAVGAVDRAGSLWNRTATGASTEGAGGEERVWPNQKPEVTAPGVSIISTSDPNLAVPYSSSTGTSDATVFVTGALALILERHGDALTRNGLDADREDVDLVKEALSESCRQNPLQGGEHHPRFGYGMLDAVAWERAVADAIATRI